MKQDLIKILDTLQLNFDSKGFLLRNDEENLILGKNIFKHFLHQLITEIK